MTRTTTHNEFVLVNSTTGNDIDTSLSTTDPIHALRTMAENMLTTCDRLAATRTSGTSAGQLDVDQRSMSEQMTQTELMSTSSQCSGKNDVRERHCAEMETLKRKLKEIVDMNVGWQLLHEQREKHVTDLTRQLVDLRLSMTSSSAAAEAGSRDDESRPDENEDDVEGLRRKCRRLESEKREMVATNASLQARLGSAEDLARQLEQAVDRLNADLESVARDKESFIDMLQAQILVYREDFECERHDRERAQSKLIELKTELEYIKKRMIDEPVARHQMAPVCNHPHHAAAAAAPRYVTRPIPSSEFQRTAGSAAAVNAYPPYDYRNATGCVHPTRRSDYGVYDVINYGRDEVDCETRTDSFSQDLTARGGADDADAEVDGLVLGEEQEEKKNKEEIADLRCPNCHRAFTIDEHVELMDHMEVCA